VIVRSIFAFNLACAYTEVNQDLRHTAATRLANAGTDAFTIAAILGHSTIQMSARYTHATDGRKRSAVERMSDSQNPGHVSVTQIEAAS
jgi:integrase